MSLKNQITEDMKSAMKAGDKDRLKVVRLIMAAIKQVEVDTRTELDDAAVLGVLNKMVKQRRDSVEQFEQGGREDLAASERAEIEILQAYPRTSWPRSSMKPLPQPAPKAFVTWARSWGRSRPRPPVAPIWARSARPSRNALTRSDAPFRLARNLRSGVACNFGYAVEKAITLAPRPGHDRATFTSVWPD